MLLHVLKNERKRESKRQEQEEQRKRKREKGLGMAYGLLNQISVFLISSSGIPIPCGTGGLQLSIKDSMQNRNTLGEIQRNQVFHDFPNMPNSEGNFVEMIRYQQGKSKQITILACCLKERIKIARKTWQG